ncbi:MAG: hypothetical protein IJI14_14825 [Anaerolineaceae bacterium]|nr:hypothetical protein [Anaerolineaceae bacterium]
MQISVFMNEKDSDPVVFTTSYRMPKVGGKYKGCNVTNVRQVYPDTEQYFANADCYDYFEVDIDLGKETKTIYICRENGTVAESLQRWQQRNAAVAQKLYELIDDLYHLSCSDDEIVREMTKVLEINYPVGE